MRNHNTGVAFGKMKWPIFLATIIFVAFAMAVSGVHAGSTAPVAEKTAQQEFKNVQALKNIPADDLIPAIEFISSSLGVECNFCHVRDAFDKDDKKPKKIARQMIKMVLAINGKDFRGQKAVTCYTCHRGHRTPVSIPAIEQSIPSGWDTPYVSEVAGADNAPVQANSGLPAAADLIAKYVSALGGASAIDAISSRVEQGTVSFDNGPPFPIERLSKMPDKQILTVHMPAGDSSTAFDGQKGWLSFPGSPIREMHHADFEGARLDADLHFPTDLQKTFAEFKTVQRSRVEGSDTIVVFASNPGQPPLELYFDQSAGLLLREVRFATSPLGLNPTQIDYADYKDYDGVKVPVHLVISGANRRLDIHFDQVKQNVPVDDAKFGHP